MRLETRAIDFVGYNKRGEIVLLAEAKSRTGTTDEWASQLRKNILAHGELPQARFFLIATPDRIYIWKQEGPDDAEAPPSAVVDAHEAFASYFKTLDWPASQIGPEGFEFLVRSWLTDLAGSSSTASAGGPSLHWLVESRFLDAIQGARIEHNAA